MLIEHAQRWSQLVNRDGSPRCYGDGAQRLKEAIKLREKGNKIQ